MDWKEFWSWEEFQNEFSDSLAFSKNGVNCSTNVWILRNRNLNFDFSLNPGADFSGNDSFRWILADSKCFVAFRQFSSVFVVFHGFSWFFMVFHGFSWFFMVFHGFSWFFMVFGRFSKIWILQESVAISKWNFRRFIIAKFSWNFPNWEKLIS